MKKLVLLKVLVVVVLSLALVTSLTTLVFADDEDTSDFNWDEATNIVEDGNNAPAVENNTPTTNNVNGLNDTNSFGENNVTGDDTNNSVDTNFSNTEVNLYVSNNANTNSGYNTNVNANEDENENVDSLAYTGIGNNGIIVLVVIGGIMLSIYSYKKFKEYNNI